ncbi:MAG: O-antigen ligase family protein [Granulosicoccus sp.]
MSASQSSANKRRRTRSRYLGNVDIRREQTGIFGRKDSGQASKWRARLQPWGLVFLVNIVIYVRRQLSSMLASPWFLALPLSLLLLSTSTDYLVLTHLLNAADSLFYSDMPVPVEDDRREPAESLKKKVQAGIYLFAFALCLLNWREIVAYFRQWPHLLLLILVLLCGVIYSIEPGKVITNSILILVSILVSMLFALGQPEALRYQNFYMVVLVPLFGLHLASFFLLFGYGVDIPGFLGSNQRYGGLLGNPNTLGGSAVLGMWAAGCLAFTRRASFRRKSFALFSMLVFSFSIIISGSGTALATVFILAAILLWMRLLAAVSTSVRSAMNTAIALLAVMTILAVLIYTTPAKILLLVTESLGKDATLTGRTELWGIARAAIAQHPWFGWGFDSHTSVKAVSEFDISFNHYHNGFLDTMVSGGVVLLSLVVYNLARFTREFSLAFRRDAAVFPMIMPLIILLLLNLSEYSLMRPLSEQWQIYVCAFVLLTWYGPAGNVRRTPRQASAKRRNNRKSLRWA